MIALSLSILVHAAVLSLSLGPPPSCIPKTAFSDHAIVVRTEERTSTPKKERTQKQHPDKKPTTTGIEGSRETKTHPSPVLRPEYPVVSQRLGQEGRVVIRAMIDTDGIVLTAYVVHSSGFAPLDREALRVVKMAHFNVSRATEREFSFKFELQ